MENINLVADKILCFFRDKGENITNLKLQKLLYYCQAWSLALNDVRLFEGRFQAWTHGPVNRTVYDRFSGYRWRPIMDEVAEPRLSEQSNSLINDVLEAYGGFGAYELERITHIEAPWVQARGDLPPDEPSVALIDEGLMRDYYRSLQQ